MPESTKHTGAPLGAPDWIETLREAGVPAWTAAPASLPEVLRENPELALTLRGPGGGAAADEPLRIAAGTSVWVLGRFRGVYRWEGDELVFTVDAAGPPRGVFGPEGGLGFTRTPEGALETWHLRPDPLPVPPLERWLEGCDDAWLGGESRRRASDGSDWGRLVAAGTIWRLRREDADEAIAEVEELWQRGARATALPDEVWARTWSPAESLGVCLHAVARADALLAALEQLEVTWEAGDRAARSNPGAELRPLRALRDELAGIDRLLAVAPEYDDGARATARDLRAILALADAVGRRLRRSCAETLGGEAGANATAEPTDVLFGRAGARHPGEWWVRGYDPTRDDIDERWTGLDA